MKTGIIMQARMGSTRLPGKVLTDLMGKPVLLHTIDRLKQCKKVGKIIVATTISPRDDIIFDKSNEFGVKVFRGSEENVLERYYQAALANDLDTIVRITSDCPLIDPHIIDLAVDEFEKGGSDLVSNAGAELSNRTFPRGLDCEVFSLRALEQAYYKASEQYQREHVTPYIYENMKVFFFKNNKNHSNYRWTLDTVEDLELISEIYKNLYKGKHDFYFKDILELMINKPELQNINAHIEQKKTQQLIIKEVRVYYRKDRLISLG
ncbi:MAG: acylneuraminate cytidylyltransferase [Ruminiclostridium sp.]|nr:acylneuraminate cytidylyltransferase [Ruminiclostridium sp.]